MKTSYEILENIHFLEDEINVEKDNVIELKHKIFLAETFIKETQSFVNGLKWCLNEKKEEVINEKSEKTEKQN